MSTSAEILEILDRRAEAFEFPVLDNVNARFIAGRFRGFRRSEDWGLLFEILVFAPQERAIVTDVYAYGPLVGDDGWVLAQIGGIDELPETPLWNANGLWISDPGIRVISVGGKKVKVSCGIQSRVEIPLNVGECADEICFARALVQRIGLEKLVPVNVVFDHVPGLGLAEPVFALTNWDHPDIAGGETPHDSEAIVAAARLLAGETNVLEYDHFRDNLNSSQWDQDG